MRPRMVERICPSILFVVLASIVGFTVAAGAGVFLLKPGLYALLYLAAIVTAVVWHLASPEEIERRKLARKFMLEHLKRERERRKIK